MGSWRTCNLEKEGRGNPVFNCRLSLKMGPCFCNAFVARADIEFEFLWRFEMDAKKNLTWTQTQFIDFVLPFCRLWSCRSPTLSIRCCYRRSLSIKPSETSFCKSIIYRSVLSLPIIVKHCRVESEE